MTVGRGKMMVMMMMMLIGGRSRDDGGATGSCGAHAHHARSFVTDVVILVLTGTGFAVRRTVLGVAFQFMLRAKQIRIEKTKFFKEN